MSEVSYKGHRYPAGSSRTACGYITASQLSFREVEELMGDRGVIVTSKPSSTGVTYCTRAGRPKRARTPGE